MIGIGVVSGGRDESRWVLRRGGVKNKIVIEPEAATAWWGDELLCGRIPSLALRLGWGLICVVGGGDYAVWFLEDVGGYRANFESGLGLERIFLSVYDSSYKIAGVLRRKLFFGRVKGYPN